jgi:hypothetical protein
MTFWNGKKIMRRAAGVSPDANERADDFDQTPTKSVDEDSPPLIYMVSKRRSWGVKQSLK